MPCYLFEYVQLFSYMGDGTPDDPGGDFEMYCWIAATDPHAALQWGYVLLGDYYRARFARSPDADDYQGVPMRHGRIVDDAAQLAKAHDWPIPLCRVGQIPAWHEPWRTSNTGRH